MSLKSAVCAHLAYRFIEHACLSFLVLAFRTVDEAVAEHVIIDASVAALSVG